jgi:tellurite methyltransferase
VGENVNEGTAHTVATAHRYWDETWKTENGRAQWSEADQWVAEVVPLLRGRGARRTLDLGCGPGRHTLFFARARFESYGLDGSAGAIEYASKAGAEAGVQLALKHGDLITLPYPDGFFDYVLAFNVVYHGTEQTLTRTLSEIRRILRPGGLYQCTMLSKRNIEYGRGDEVSPNAFVQWQGGGDKTHPHMYADAPDLLRLHTGFDLLFAKDHDQTGAGEYHWYCLFETDGADATKPRRAVGSHAAGTADASSDIDPRG